MYKNIINNHASLAIFVRITHIPADATIAEKIQQVVENILSHSPLLYVAKEVEKADVMYEINYESGWIEFNYIRRPFIISSDEDEATWSKKLGILIFDMLESNEAMLIDASAEKWLKKHTIDPHTVGCKSFTIKQMVGDSPLHELANAIMDSFPRMIDDLPRFPEHGVEQTTTITIEINQDQELVVATTRTLPEGYYFVLRDGKEYVSSRDAMSEESWDIEKLSLASSYSKEILVVYPSLLRAQCLTDDDLQRARNEQIEDDLLGSCDIVKYSEGKPLPLFEIPKSCISTSFKQTTENYITMLLASESKDGV